MREDHVLDNEVPLWAPIPALAEMQVALELAVGEVTGLAGGDLIGSGASQEQAIVGETPNLTARLQGRAQGERRERGHCIDRADRLENRFRGCGGVKLDRLARMKRMYRVRDRHEDRNRQHQWRFAHRL